MEGPEKWTELCEQASKEQDANKLMALLAQIIRLLDEKKTRVTGSRLPGPQPLDPTI